MSIIRSEDSRKWINTLIASCAVLAGYASIRFIVQLGEWFDLEAKVGNFLGVTQGAGVLIGLAVFVGVSKNKKAMTLLNEVYGELVKAVWPQKDAIVKITIGLVVSLSIVSLIFVAIDLMFRKILEFIY